MGGIIAPSTSIGGSVLAPGIPMQSTPLGGLYQLPGLNGLGYAFNQLNYWTLTAMGVTFGNAPAVGYAVSPMAGSPFGPTANGGFCVEIHPTLPFAYAPAVSLGVTYVYRQDPSTGKLTKVSNIGNSFACMAISPDGLHLYGMSSGTIRVFSINQSTGALTLAFTHAFGGVNFPRGVDVSPDGKFVVGANTAGAVGQIIVASRNAVTGALTQIAGSPFATGGASTASVAFSPDGINLFAADNAGATVYGYQFNPTTGAISPAPGSPFATGGTQPQALTVSPDGSHVFTANVTGNSISVFSRAVSAVLTPIASSPIATGVQPVDILTSPDNLHVAVSIGGTIGSTLSIYSRNTSTGALTPIAGSPFASPVRPLGLAFSHDSQFIYYTDFNPVPNAIVYGLTTAATPVYNLINATFDPTGGLGGSVNINGSISVNGSPVSGDVATSVVMVANAGTLALTPAPITYVDITGVLTATGNITTTFPATPTTVVLDNATTGAFTLQLNAGAYIVPRGRSIWFWNAATFEMISAMPPIAAANNGKFLRVDANGGPVWDGVNTYIPVAMVANAGTFTVEDTAQYLIEVTGALTAQGALGVTFTVAADPMTLVVDNKTTGGFPLVLAGTWIMPPGVSYWYYDGAAHLEPISANVNRLQNVAMVANAATLTLLEISDNIIEVTGALTANGNITTTFPTNATQVVFDNACTGAFLLQLNAGAYTIPLGKSTWYWNGATLELISSYNSGTFTGTVTGLTAALTATISYKIVNTICTLHIPQNALNGISNATTYTITGLPAAVSPSNTVVSGMMFVQDNSNPALSGQWQIAGGGNTIILYLSNGGTWTASGIKGFYETEFIYQL